MRDIGRGAAHVETDDALETGQSTHASRADDAARRAGEDGILALEAMGIGEPAIRLHELQTHIPERGLYLLDITAQDRREIGIDHGGVPARYELHERRDFMRDAHLGEADGPCQLGQALFMLRITVAMHEANGTGA
jgi:hypothetical protein